MKYSFLLNPPKVEFNHENTKIGKHEIQALLFFRVFVHACFRDFICPNSGGVRFKR